MNSVRGKISTSDSRIFGNGLRKISDMCVRRSPTVSTETICKCGFKNFQVKKTSNSNIFMRVNKYLTISVNKGKVLNVSIIICKT